MRILKIKIYRCVKNSLLHLQTVFCDRDESRAKTPRKECIRCLFSSLLFFLDIGEVVWIQDSLFELAARGKYKASDAGNPFMGLSKQDNTAISREKWMYQLFLGAMPFYKRAMKWSRVTRRLFSMTKTSWGWMISQRFLRLSHLRTTKSTSARDERRETNSSSGSVSRT
jgi:hypothetical protein